MIKNSLGRVGRVAAAVGLATAAAFALAAGCGSAHKMPPGYQGVVELDERHISFEVPGKIAELPAQRGQVMAAGALIARLDDGLEKPARAARAAELDAARAQVALIKAGARAEDVRGVAAQVRGAEASLAKVQTNLTRAKKLLADGAINSSEVENLQHDEERAGEEVRAQRERLRMLQAGNRPEELAAAEARAASAAAALDLEDQRLRRFTLVADAPGVVVDVHAKAGEVAAAGMPIVTLADAAHPYVDVFVPIGALAELRVGREATVRVDGDAEPWRGKVEDIARHTEFTPRYLFSQKERPNLVVRVRVRLDDPKLRIHAGIPAFVTWGSES
jgi:multidrug resistance efflux pump